MKDPFLFVLTVAVDFLDHGSCNVSPSKILFTFKPRKKVSLKRAKKTLFSSGKMIGLAFIQEIKTGAQAN